MINGSILRINPSELKFQVEQRRFSSCCLQLTNKTDKHVVFRIQTTKPRKYVVRPSCAVIKPWSTCSVKLVMSAPSVSPANMHCKDRFLIQSMPADAGILSKNITAQLFINAPDKIVEEFKLGVIYVPINRPSAVTKDFDEAPLPRSSSAMENEAKRSSLIDAVSSSLRETPTVNLPEVLATIQKLIEEKNHVIQQNEKLSQEIEDLRKRSTSSTDRYSFIFVILVILLGIIYGRVFKST